MLESCLRRLCHVSWPSAGCICCVYASAADSGTTGTHRVFPYLAEVALRAGTFLLPLKSFGPSHSNPESSKPRAWRTTVPLGTWRHYLWTGLCTLQRQSERAALPGGTTGGREGGGFAVGRGREQFGSAQRPSPRGWKDTKVPASSYATGRCKNRLTPGLQIQEPSSSEGMPCSQPPGARSWERVPSVPRERQSCFRAPWAFAQCVLPCVLEIMTALGRTKSNKFSFQVPP